MSSHSGQRALLEELLARIADGDVTLEYLRLVQSKGVTLDGVIPGVPIRPIELAIGCAQPKSVEVLIQAGVDSRVRDPEGRSLLRLAANGGSPCIPALLAAGADIEEVDENGNSVLMHAAANHDARAVKILLEHGANPSVKNRHGMTARDLTRSPQVIALLPPKSQL